MASGLYGKLMHLNAAAFEGGNYDAAYHILMAALHSTEGDREALEEVRRLSLKQLATIDADHPEYDHSSASARKRGHMSVYEMLSEQARAMSAIARSAQLVKHVQQVKARAKPSRQLSRIFESPA